MIRFYLIIAVCFVAAASARASSRERISFNQDWRFTMGDPEGVTDLLDERTISAWLAPQRLPFEKNPKPPTTSPTKPGAVLYAQPAFSDSSWRALNLPHDWAIEGDFKQAYSGGTGKLAYWGVGWYRKTFTLPETVPDSRVYLDIDGAMSNALVWINGHFVGGWAYGYSSFRVDLSAHIKRNGPNTLAIRLNNLKDSARWYPGGGIYRNTWLVQTSPIHVDHYGVQVVTPEISATRASITVNTTVKNTFTSPAEVGVKTEVYALDPSGRRQGQALAKGKSAPLSIPAGQHANTSTALTLSEPKLWSPRAPHRYVAITTIWRNGALLDEYETPFGVRSFRFDPDRGFFLNGESVRLNGVCMHHDLGALGAAINVRALERQIGLLQEMGANAIRTSHNPPAPEFLELCDRMGMLVQVESFDVWAQTKKTNDYGRYWRTWHEADLRAMVRRDRNHPSIIMWSVGNEVGEQWSKAIFPARLQAIVREEDNTRPVTMGCNVVEAGYNGFQKGVDVFGYNYKPGQYSKFHEKHPTIPVYGSETASTVSSRGEYFFPLENHHSDFQVSSYDLSYPHWAMTPDTEFAAQDKYPFVAGEFVWTGFDYLGEPTPYNNDATNLLNMADPKARARLKDEIEKLGKIQVPSRSSYFGILDLAGFKKDRFYLYQARWRPGLPMAHILPHWNWPERVGQVTPVHVYTSGDEAELFLNGRSLGRKKKGTYEYRLRWDDVNYEPGTLKVVAYKNDQRWTENSIKTTGAAAKLTLTPDRATLAADGLDLSFVTVTVADQDGLLVPRSKQSIRFEISGPGEIVATDNGDATDHTSFQSATRKAFNGLALVIVRTKPGQSGKITIKASADGLAYGETTLNSH